MIPRGGGAVVYTDGVAQGLLWATDVQQPGIYGAPDPRWNVNQSGTFTGVYQPIVAVIWSQTNHTLDIWSVGAFQWNPALQPYLTGNVPMLTLHHAAAGRAVSSTRLHRAADSP